ncbi:MAG TPA: aminotransferase class V-fold PLP-dependent enzyme, partial [Alphaproteobacteria bacterium]|nr:aminotransferase class V-fold PLP-dependent enzyme [Alphaproteobacteria bacterium]
KLNGPKGVGCLYAADPGRVISLLLGGPQERRLRGGTENVAGIAGFGEACALAREGLAERTERAAALRDRLWERLVRTVPGIRRNGSAEHVLPNTLSVEIPGVASDVLVEALDLEGVAASAGAACHSGSVSPSHVLLAMGRTVEQARATLRLSVGQGNDAAQIDRAAGIIGRLVARAHGEEPA